MSKLIDLSGQRFGRLTVIERAGSQWGHRTWKCVCDCGKVTIVTSSHLQNGMTTSCGCYQKQVAKEANTTHALTKTRLHSIWANMIQRCTNIKASGYLDYGGRGITVCDVWRNDFKEFYDWALVNGYDDTMTIDRIDVNGNYCPDNCRWTTKLKQANNKRNNRMLTFGGSTHTLAEWSDITGIKQATLFARLKKGWTIERALTTPTK